VIAEAGRRLRHTNRFTTVLAARFAAPFIQERRADSEAKAARRKAATAAKRAASGIGTRAYRRVPGAEQVMNVYRRAGSIVAVAQHFGVPRYTVDGWARRLRARGHAIGR
jgi:hypothetical protein